MNPCRAAILLVDTDPPCLQPLSEALSTYGYAPTLWRDSWGALAHFCQTTPAYELVLIHVQSLEPQLLCQRLRQEPAGAVTPVAFVGSGHGSLRSSADALQAGGDFYCADPCDIAKVMEKIQRYLGPPPADMAQTDIPQQDASTPEKEADGRDQTQIQHKLAQVRCEDYFTMIGATWQTRKACLEAALKQTREAFDPAVFSDHIQRQQADALREIGQVLKEAEVVLQDDFLRRAYARSLTPDLAQSLDQSFAQSFKRRVSENDHRHTHPRRVCVGSFGVDADGLKGYGTQYGTQGQ